MNVVNWNYKDIAIKIIVFEFQGRFHINIVNWDYKDIAIKMIVFVVGSLF
jgi:hypothetical protein